MRFLMNTLLAGSGTYSRKPYRGVGTLCQPRQSDIDHTHAACSSLGYTCGFVHRLEATAQDDVLEVLEILLHELFGDAEKADKKARLRTLKDLDGAAATLADVCRVLLDPALPDDRVRSRAFEKIPQTLLERGGGERRRPNSATHGRILQRTRRSVCRCAAVLIDGAQTRTLRSKPSRQAR